MMVSGKLLDDGSSPSITDSWCESLYDIAVDETLLESLDEWVQKQDTIDFFNSEDNQLYSWVLVKELDSDLLFPDMFLEGPVGVKIQGKSFFDDGITKENINGYNIGYSERINLYRVLNPNVYPGFSIQESSKTKKFNNSFVTCLTS